MIPRGGTAVRYSALPVAHRQEEKERRRQERLAREEAERRASGRRQRLQLAFGALIAIIAVAGIVFAATSLGGGDDSADNKPKPSQPASESDLPKLPPQQTSDLDAAAKAAGCTLQNTAVEGANHETKDFTAADYKTNPPTSGNHNPDWYDDGIYEPGSVPRLGMLVHPLEHGRIEVQYKPGTPSTTVQQLEALLAEQSDGYHMLMFENTTGMKYAVAATAWTHLLGCPEMNDKVFDAIRSFRARFIDKGPEQVP
jgi:Protein of unknown function (DUF3105)